ncbi:rRNA-processing protein Fcf1/Utp23 [Dillenia turbinata]|uniref:rRNA-processing protein Fcf1/Utp23 n=1 Tax=Dillenia turbinata TaxID=194707 RepID=A0AAN8Z894_9MAGN
MRLKKQKRHHRIVRFYVTCYDFRKPFKVLCDGTFVHHLLVNRITPADTALSNLLSVGGNEGAKLFTTRCVLAELKSLGDSYSESFKAAYNLKIARCDHTSRKSALACIMEIVGENNPEHFFVATQDTDLRKKFYEIPGVPLIFGLRNSLHLEPPSSFQRQFAKSVEEKRLHMSDLEYKMLRKRARKMLDKEDKDTSDADEGLRDQILAAENLSKTSSSNMAGDMKDRPQFKRKKAKGPNPLSCKKKKIHKLANLKLEKVSKCIFLYLLIA